MFYLVDDLGGLFFGTDVDERLRLVGEYDVELTDVAATPDGRLFALSTDTLYEISFNSFEIAEVGALSLGGNAFDGATGFEIAPNGDTFVTASGSGNLYELDLATGALGVIGDTGITTTEGDLLWSDGSLYLAGDGTVAEVNPNNGGVISSEDLDVIGLDGLASAGGEAFGFAEDLVFAFDADALDFAFDGQLDSSPATPFSDTTGATGLPGSDATPTDEEARQVGRLFDAGLDRDGDIRFDGVNFWIDRLEDGATLNQISQAFIDSDEFAAVNGDPDELSNEEFVQALFNNVLDRDGAEAGVDFWTSRLDDGALTRAEVLRAFADSTEFVEDSARTNSLTEMGTGTYDFLADFA